MEVREVKKRKNKFQSDVLRLIQDFERETGTMIECINVDKQGFFHGDRLSTVEIEITL